MTGVTVTVVGTADGRSRVAVTVASPPFSAMAVGFSVRAAAGGGSSSRTVRAAPVTVMVVESAAARALPTVAVTVPVRSGSSVALATATMVAPSVGAAVVPAARRMVASAPTV